MQNNIIVKNNSTPEIRQLREKFYKLFKNSPLPAEEELENIGLFINSQIMKKILFLNDIYKKILDVNGVIMEFGVRWGQNLALLSSFRDIYEPYNRHRRIIGFDTFEGLLGINQKDGDSVIAQKGSYSVTKGYEHYLENILNYHNQESAINHIKKFELIKGDASETLKTYLEKNPQTIISLAYFDFDIYEPTKNCLELIKEYLTKGTVVCFDELNIKDFPGETTALKEVFGLDKYKITRSKYSAAQAYIVIS